MGEEDEQHPHLGYEAWASEFCQLLFSGNLPPIPTADIPALELRAESLGESDREQRGVAQSESLAGKMPAKGSDKSLRHEGAPMMLRLLWLPARHGGGQAERVCNSLAVYLRPKLTDLGCVVISGHLVPLGCCVRLPIQLRDRMRPRGLVCFEWRAPRVGERGTPLSCVWVRGCKSACAVAS